MRSFLLAPAALMALCAPAYAELDLTLGGYTSFQAAAFDNDGANSSSRDFQSEAEIFLSGEAIADNGLTYGARIELLTSSTDSENSDEASLWLSGLWGKLELGDNDGASDLVRMAPTTGVGQINGSYDDYIPTADRGHNRSNRGSKSFRPLDTDDATKLTYTTPLYGGWQVGLTYTPFLSSFGENVQTTSTQAQDLFEFGFAKQGKLAEFGYYLSAGFNMGNGAAGQNDLQSWGLGAQFSHGGFRAGGGYSHNGDSLNPVALGDDRATSWNLGATYAWDRLSVGLSYLQMTFNENGDASGQAGTDGAGGDYTALALGAGYKIAPGLTTGADLAFYERSRPAGADSSGWVLVADTSAAF
jgi:outer membrane protein OmpU